MKKKIMLNKLGTSSWSWEPTILFRIATTALGERNQFWVQDFDGTCCREKRIW
jgi:hypothetical protein